MRMIEAVLQGDGELAFTQQVLLNGAVRLQLIGKVGSIEEGLYACKSLLDSGQPLERYAEWRRLLRAFSVENASESPLRL
ncbi:hypothetical protein [Cohnella sp. REN36]|uniref:hypothetical protein n=1 Tax=Cohnella sp. REN36 TaxID=2887347 RepID=UPI00351D08F9